MLNWVPYVEENIAPCCFVCNMGKGEATPLHYYKRCQAIRDKWPLDRQGSIGTIDDANFVKHQTEREYILSKMSDQEKEELGDGDVTDLHRADHYSADVLAKIKAYRAPSYSSLPGRKFEIESHIAAQYVESPCHYCGKAPNIELGSSGLSGIDRNGDDYLRSHIVPACWDCNHHKLDWPIQDFLLHSLLVASNSSLAVIESSEQLNDLFRSGPEQWTSREVNDLCSAANLQRITNKMPLKHIARYAVVTRPVEEVREEYQRRLALDKDEGSLQNGSLNDEINPSFTDAYGLSWNAPAFVGAFGQLIGPRTPLEVEAGVEVVNLLINEIEEEDVDNLPVFSSDIIRHIHLHLKKHYGFVRPGPSLNNWLKSFRKSLIKDKETGRYSTKKGYKYLTPLTEAEHEIFIARVKARGFYSPSSIFTDLQGKIPSYVSKKSIKQRLVSIKSRLRNKDRAAHDEILWEHTDFFYCPLCYEEAKTKAAFLNNSVGSSIAFAKGTRPPEKRSVCKKNKEHGKYVLWPHEMGEPLKD